MVEVYKTFGEELKATNTFEDGIWVNMTNPNMEEIDLISGRLKIDVDYLKAALDEEERSHIEADNGQILFVVDVPYIEEGANQSYLYETIPLAIIIAKESIITVCLKNNTVIKDFVDRRVKTFYTYKKTRFLLQILYRNAEKYLFYLRQIDKRSSVVEKELHKAMKNQELIELLGLEKSLVYFSTSLKSNEVVLEKLMRLEEIKKYPEDTDLLEDVIVENKQAMEMAKIYSDILSGTMDAFASIISNNQNNVMKLLASVTIVISIPTLISSFYGMNVDVPFENNPYIFYIIAVIAIVISLIAVYIMQRKKLF